MNGAMPWSFNAFKPSNEKLRGDSITTKANSSEIMSILMAMNMPTENTVSMTKISTFATALLPVPTTEVPVMAMAANSVEHKARVAVIMEPGPGRLGAKVFKTVSYTHLTLPTILLV